METYPTLLITALFIISAILIWFAGINLAKTTRTIDSRYKLGDALGGLILLGIATSLPEIAITVSAALANHLSVIIGNLIGGIAIQTFVIIIFDFLVKDKKPISYLAGSLILFFEALFVIVMTLITVAASFYPKDHVIFHINPLSIIILLAWITGLYIINKLRLMPKFNITAQDASPGRRHHERRATYVHPFYSRKSNVYVISIFIFAALVTLGAGVLLEESGVALATKLNINTGIFAATIIALITALPEISTGIESVRFKDNLLAVSDIFGGNAFMPALFIVADLLAAKSVLSFMSKSDYLLVILGIAMTAVYGVAYLVKPKKLYFRIGLDSWLVFFIYTIGIFYLLYFL